MKTEEINKKNDTVKNDVVENEEVTEPVNENSEEKDSEKAEPEAALNDIPLGASLDKYTEEIRNTVYAIMGRNGIPASLMDYMLCMVLMDVRDLKAKEYATQISGKE